MRLRPEADNEIGQEHFIKLVTMVPVVLILLALS